MEFPLIGLAEVVVLVFLIGDRATEIKNPIVHHPQVTVIGGLDLKSDQAVVNAIGIDLDGNRLLLLGIF
jgi:hypothetical protein